jgi:hypothetical protein
MSLCSDTSRSVAVLVLSLSLILLKAVVEVPEKIE